MFCQENVLLQQNPRWKWLSLKPGATPDASEPGAAWKKELPLKPGSTPEARSCLKNCGPPFLDESQRAY